jgi:anti-sigma factor (TIGR02949 family)
MSCPELLQTQSFIDGEVDAAQAEAVERHISECAECQAFCADAAALSDTIRTSATRHAAPPELRERIAAALEAADSADIVRPDWRAASDARASRRSFWMGALGGAGVTGLAASLAILTVLPPSATTLADQVTDAHTRALMSGRTIAVVSSDHHPAKPWFAGRIDISPPVQDFAAEGFKLTGGRVDKVAGVAAAVLTYQHGRHEVDLFVWADRGSTLPTNAVRHGYHLVFWRSGDLNFAAVSDTAVPELANFVQLVRSEPE